MSDFVSSFYQDTDSFLKLLENEKDTFWIERGEKAVMGLFYDMHSQVPAYKKLLLENQVDQSAISSVGDLQALPLTNKENYLQAFTTSELCWNGEFVQNQWIISSTSGSTGEPYYFPRSKEQDKQFAITAEAAIKTYFEIDKKSTLFLDCYALGVWIGGMFMYQALRYIFDQGKYPLTIITPGADKVEAIKALKKLAGQFDQIIIGGYGPLVKDLIDDARAMGFEWNDHDVKYFFAAEGFTEGFRDYIVKYGGATSPYLSTINHYGTADLGTMAHETPMSILIRRLAMENEDFYRELFAKADKLPTLGQYVPELYYFESVDGRLACSGPGGLPLMRYDLKDNGGVYSYKEMIELCRKHGIDILEKVRELDLEQTVWELPFVYVGERGDFTVSIYSVNIYPESIRNALLVDHLQQHLTGKFSMAVEYDEEQNQLLHIHIELKKGKSEDGTIRNATLESIIHWLDKENSEWRDFYADEGIRSKVTPDIFFWEYQHDQHFRPGGKQKWVKKKKSDNT